MFEPSQLRITDGAFGYLPQIKLGNGGPGFRVFDGGRALETMAGVRWNEPRANTEVATSASGDMTGDSPAVQGGINTFAAALESHVAFVSPPQTLVDHFNALRDFANGESSEFTFDGRTLTPSERYYTICIANCLDLEYQSFDVKSRESVPEAQQLRTVALRRAKPASKAGAE